MSMTTSGAPPGTRNGPQGARPGGRSNADVPTRPNNGTTLQLAPDLAGGA